MTTDSPAQPLPLSRVPGPRGWPILGQVLEVWSDPLRLLVDGMRAHGDIVRFSFGPTSYLLVNDPDAVQHVLQNSPKSYAKSRNYQGIRLVLGDGLLTSEGELWRRQRKLAQPAFHPGAVAGFADDFARCTADMLERWSALPAASIVDLHEEMMRLTFRIVGCTLFGTDVDGDARDVGDAMEVALRFANDYTQQVVRLPLWIPTPRHLRFRRALSTLEALVAKLVAERRRRSAPARDLLGMLMAAADEGGTMTDRLIRDEAMTIVLAGHETTANALTWTWRLLGEHPDWAERVRSEAIEVLGTRTPTLEDASKLVVAERVLCEAMRLFPPAWCLEREAREPDVLLGYDVPVGTVVLVCAYTLHRHERLWSEGSGDHVERFDPDRFLPERSAARHRYAYLPFGGGPRVCIGKGFAMLEAKIILAMMARAARIEPFEGQALEVEPGITLRPRAGMRVRVSPLHDPVAHAA